MNDLVTKEQVKRLIDYCQGDTDMIIWALDTQDLETLFEADSEDD